MLFIIAATLLTLFSSLAGSQNIDPSSVPLSTRQQWCTNQEASCPLLCTQVGATNTPTSNTCDAVSPIFIFWFPQTNSILRTPSPGAVSVPTASSPTPLPLHKLSLSTSVKNIRRNVQATATVTTVAYQTATPRTLAELRTQRGSTLQVARR